MWEIVLKIRHFERRLTKSLKKIKFIFKQKGSGTSHQFLFNSFIYYILSDQVWWCNVKQFLGYSKNYICKYTSIFPFGSGKCGEEGKKSQKFEYLENEKGFLDKIKNILNSF